MCKTRPTVRELLPCVDLLLKAKSKPTGLIFVGTGEKGVGIVGDLVTTTIWRICSRVG